MKNHFKKATFFLFTALLLNGKIHAQNCVWETLPPNIGVNYSPHAIEDAQVIYDEVFSFQNGEVWNTYYLKTGQIGLTPFGTSDWNVSGSIIFEGLMKRVNQIAARRVNGVNRFAFLGEYVSSNSPGVAGSVYRKAVVLYDGSSWSVLNGTPGGISTFSDFYDIDIHPVTGEVYVVYKASSTTLKVAKYNAGAWSDIGGVAANATANNLSDVQYVYDNSNNELAPKYKPELSFYGANNDLIFTYGIFNPAISNGDNFYPRGKRFNGTTWSSITVNSNGVQREGLSAYWDPYNSLQSEVAVPHMRLSRTQGTDCYLAIRRNQTDAQYLLLNSGLPNLRKMDASSSEMLNVNTTALNFAVFEDIIVDGSNNLYVGVIYQPHPNAPLPNKKALIKRDASGVVTTIGSTSINTGTNTFLSSAQRTFIKSNNTFSLFGAGYTQYGGGNELDQKRPSFNPLITYQINQGDTMYQRVGTPASYTSVEVNGPASKIAYLMDGTPIMACIDSSLVDYTQNPIIESIKVKFKKWDGNAWVADANFPPITDKLLDFDFQFKKGTNKPVFIYVATDKKLQQKVLMGTYWTSVVDVAPILDQNIDFMRIADDGKSLLWSKNDTLKTAVIFENGNFIEMGKVIPSVTNGGANTNYNATGIETLSPQMMESINIGDKTYVFYSKRFDGNSETTYGLYRTSNDISSNWSTVPGSITNIAKLAYAKQFDLHLDADTLTIAVNHTAFSSPSPGGPEGIKVARAVFVNGLYDATATNTLNVQGTLTDLTGLVSPSAPSIKVVKIGSKTYVAASNTSGQTQIWEGTTVLPGPTNSWTALTTVSNKQQGNLRFNYSKKVGLVAAWGGEDAFIYRAKTIGVTVTSPLSQSVCIGSNFTLDNFVLSNSPSTYLFNWTGPNAFSSNQENPTLTNVQNNQSGLYESNIKSGNYCSVEAGELTLSVIATPTLPAISNDTVCAGNTLHKLVVPSASYNASHNYFAVHGTDTVHLSLVSGDGYFDFPVITSTQTWVAYAQVPGSCFVTDTFQLIFKPGVSFSFTTSSGTQLCEAESFTLQFSNPSLTYQNLSAYPYNGAVNSTFTASNAGSQTLQIVGTGVNGCTYTVNQAISILPSPTLSSVSVTPYGDQCPGVARNLSAVSNGTMLWSDGIAGNHTVNPVTSTTYTVTATGTNGCTRSQSVNVIVSSNTAASNVVVNLPVVAAGMSVTATGTPAGGSWSGLISGTTNPQTFVASIPGSIFYTVPGTSGQCNGISVQDITISNTELNVSAANDTVCGVQNTSLTANLNKYLKIGNGNSVPVLTYDPPAFFNNNYESHKSQTLILANELLAQGITANDTLKAIKVNVSSLNGIGNLTQFRLRIGNTSATEMPSVNNGSFLTTTGNVIVYTTSNLIPLNGMNTLTFQNPFVWNGTSNLVLEIVNSNYVAPGQYNYTNNATTAYTNTSFRSFAMMEDDEISFSSIDAATNFAGSALSRRFNMEFVIGTASQPTWSPSPSLTVISGTAATANPVTTATYSATFTNGTATFTDNATIVVGNLSTNANITGTTCGAATGAIDLTIINPVGTYSVSWSNGAITEDLAGLSPGTYSVTITDESGCAPYTANYTVSAPGAPVLTTSGTTSLDCNGDTDGVIDLSVTGGTGTLTYSWSNGNTTQDLSGLSAGVYSVLVSDNANCSSTTSVTITEPTALNLSGIVQNIQCAGDGNGMVDITVSGGTSGYNYLWSNGSSTQDLSNINGNNYSVTVTDANGCTISDSYSVFEPSSIQVNGAVTEANCGQSDGAITLNAGGGVGSLVYSWNTGETTLSLMNISAGAYTLTITDSNNCQLIEAYAVSSIGGPVVTGTHTDASCSTSTDGSIDVTVTGNGPFTYSWTGGSTATSEDLTNLAPGTYTVEVNGSTPNCPSFGTYIIDGPVYQATASLLNTTLTADITGATYQWINCISGTIIAGETNQSYTATANGSYAVIVTDGQCSDTSDCITINNVGLSDNEELDFVIFPNPSNGLFFIQTSESVSYIVYDAFGKIIYTDTFVNGLNNIDLSSEANGVYFLHATLNQSTKVFRLIRND